MAFLCRNALGEADLRELVSTQQALGAQGTAVLLLCDECGARYICQVRDVLLSVTYCLCTLLMMLGVGSAEAWWIDKSLDMCG